MHRRDFLKWMGAAFPVLYPSAALSKILTDSTIDLRTADQHVKDHLIPKKEHHLSYKDDICLTLQEFDLLTASLNRLKQLQRIIGYANFSLIGFDDALRFSKMNSLIGAFKPRELEFFEKIFHTPAADYGFMGEKTSLMISDKISEKDVIKISGTGHYLFKGKPVDLYKSIKNEIGSDVVLTSGVRSIMKQFLLFFYKAHQENGNLSMASRSLAPPGYSFHGISDFDVGKKGFGISNFTEQFVTTNVYWKLSDLGYIKFRYTRNNELGVRFEPWHIKVA